MDAWPQVGLILLLIVFGGFLAGSEVALISLREGQLQRLEQQGGRGARLAGLARDPNRFLSAVQVGITVAGFLAASAGGAYFADLLEPRLDVLGRFAPAAALVLVTLVISYASLVLGELVPKRLALQRTEGWALTAVRPLGALAAAFRPAIWLLSHSTDLVVRALGGDPARAREEMTEEELRELVETRETFTPEQRSIIGGAFEVAERTLRQIVRPRRDVVTVPPEATAAEARRILASSRHSRAPVAADDLVDVHGIVTLLDLVGADGPVDGYVRDAVVIPETVGVLDALRRLQAERQQMAIVINEHGDVEGIVTVEDLLEEIVGEIYDEFDRDTRPVRADRAGTVDLDGTFPVHDLPDLGIDLPAGEYATVAGLVLEHLGHIPDPGEAVEVNDWRIEVLEVDRQAVTRLRLRRVPSPSP